TYSGISFWAKGTLAASTEWGGIDANTVVVWLVQDGTMEGATQFAARQVITDTWTKYEIPFADFLKDGVTAWSGSTVERIKFQLIEASFDVHLDEIGYY